LKEKRLFSEKKEKRTVLCNLKKGFIEFSILKIIKFILFIDSPSKISKH
jgi:hypothetical protein